MHLNDFNAVVAVNGVEAQEYSFETSPDGKSATCWIASEEGKSFSVVWKCRSAFRHHYVSGYVDVDGIKCRGKIMPEGPLGRHDTAERAGISTSDATWKPFIFSQIQLTDDDSVLGASASDKIGEIKLKIKRVRLLGTARSRHCPFDAPQNQKLHERSKKATSHRVGLGNDIMRPPRKALATEDIDRQPIATFIWKYRPLDVLKATEIAPPNKMMQPQGSQEEPIIVEEGPISATRDSQVAGPVKRERRDSHSQPPSKRARHVDLQRAAKRIKTEKQATSIPHLGSSEIIDLT